MERQHINYGIRRGVVVNNEDPEYRGRVKVFVPGVYPEAYKTEPDKLPWAEPAMSLFGGNWTNSTKDGKNKETGVCTVPHAGKDGDGAQVWVFFDSNDINYPIYFAIAQSGDGWFSKHNNQHVIQTDNVSIIVDEYETYKNLNTNDQISDKLAEEVYNGNPSELNKSVNNLGGVDQISQDLDTMNGTQGLSSFIEQAGGYEGLSSIERICNNGLSSLTNFINDVGGISSFSEFISSAGGMQSVVDAMNGVSGDAEQAIIDRFGSIEDFSQMLTEVGGVEGLSSIADNFGGIEGLQNAVDTIGGVDGLSALSGMTSSLGGVEGMKSLTDNMVNGISGFDDLVVGKAEENAKLNQETDNDSDERVTKSDTYTTAVGTKSQMISAHSRSKLKTRVKIAVKVPEDDIGVDLNIEGDVNLHLKGNLYKEVIGNIIETHIGDKFLYHEGSTVVTETGTNHRESGGIQEIVKGNRIETITGSDLYFCTGYSARDVEVAEYNYGTRNTKVSRINSDYFNNQQLNFTGDFGIFANGTITLAANNVDLFAVNRIGNSAIYIENNAKTSIINNALASITDTTVTRLTNATTISDVASTSITETAPTFNVAADSITEEALVSYVLNAGEIEETSEGSFVRTATETISDTAETINHVSTNLLNSAVAVETVATSVDVLADTVAVACDNLTVDADSIGGNAISLMLEGSTDATAISIATALAGGAAGLAVGALVTALNTNTETIVKEKGSQYENMPEYSLSGADANVLSNGTIVSINKSKLEAAGINIGDVKPGILVFDNYGYEVTSGSDVLWQWSGTTLVISIIGENVYVDGWKIKFLGIQEKSSE